MKRIKTLQKNYNLKFKRSKTDEEAILHIIVIQSYTDPKKTD